MMLLFLLDQDSVDEVWKKNIAALGWGMFDQIFTLRLIIEKYISEQAPSFLSSIDYEQTFDSAGRRALTRVLSLYGKLDKYIKVISARYRNNTAAAELGNEVSSWFCIESGV